MPIIRESDFSLQMNTKNFMRAYFIYGEDKYLIDYYTKLLTDKIVAGNGNSFNLQDFKSLDFDVDMLHTAVEALPLMSPMKCVRVFDLDIEKEDQNTMKKLKDIICDIPDTTVLIFSLPGLEIDNKRSSKWGSFIKFFEKYGAVFNVSVMNKIKLKRQLIRWAEKLSCALEEDDAERIIEKSGENLLILKHEMEKLCAYAKNSKITRDHIEELVVDNIEANIFDLTKSIIFKNYKKAFDIIDTLLYKKEEPTMILAIISSIYVDIYRVKVAMNSGKDIYEITDIFDYKRKEFRLQNAQRDMGRMSMTSIRKCLDLLAQTDAKLKSSRVDSRILLEELVSKLSRQT